MFLAEETAQIKKNPAALEHLETLRAKYSWSIGNRRVRERRGLLLWSERQAGLRCPLELDPESLK